MITVTRRREIDTTKEASTNNSSIKCQKKGELNRREKEEDVRLSEFEQTRR